MPGWFKDDPVEIFRRHVWINPFWEDDLDAVVEWVGADRVIFGSDWPHIEALPQPLDYLPETKASPPRTAGWYSTTTPSTLPPCFAPSPGT